MLTEQLIKRPMKRDSGADPKTPSALCGLDDPTYYLPSAVDISPGALTFEQKELHPFIHLSN